MGTSLAPSRQQGGNWISNARQQPTVSIRKAKKQYEEAHGQFQNALMLYDKKHLSRFTAICSNRSPPSEQDVLRTVMAITDRAPDRKKTANMSRIFERLLKLAPVGDVVVGGAQSLAVSGAWGAVRLALEVSVNYLAFFERVSDIFLEIGKFSETNYELAVLFPHSMGLKASAFEYLTIILEISAEVVNNARKSRAKRMLSAILDDFSSNVEPLASRLRSVAQAIDRTARVEAIKDNQVAHRNTQASLRQLSFLSRSNTEKSEEKDLNDWRYRLVQQLESEGKGCGHRWSYFFGKGRSNWLLGLDSYKSWKNSSTSSTFWLNGKLGSGKSVAMASICGDLTSSYDDSETHCTTVSHFFCNSEASGVRASTILASLTAQIVRSPVMTSPFATCLARHGGPKLMELATNSCTDMLLDLTPSHWRCFLVLDGLDQLPLDELVALFEQLARLSSSRIVLVCLSSHDDQNRLRKIKSILFDASSVTNVDMDGFNRSSEAAEFIDAEFAKWERRGWRFAQRDSQHMISQALLKHWNSMFLWLKLQMELLEDALQDQEDIDYNYVLGRIHPDLDALYEQRLLGIPEVNRRMSRVILQLVAATTPPLNVKELRIAANIDPGNTSWSPTTLPRNASAICVQYGAKLLEVDESCDEIHLIHGSVAVHLCRPMQDGSEKTASLRFSFSEATNRLGLICLTYLNLPELDTVVALRPKSADSQQTDRGTLAVIGRNLLDHSHEDRRWLSPVTSMRQNRLDTSLDVSAFLGNMAKTRAADYVLTDFLGYVEAHWLTVTRNLELADAQQELWNRVCYGNTRYGKLPDNITAPETGLPWAIEHGHRLLFCHHAYRNRPKRMVSKELTLRLMHLVLFEWKNFRIQGQLADYLVGLCHQLWKSDRAAFDDHWQNLILLVYPEQEISDTTIDADSSLLRSEMASGFLELLLRSSVGREEFASTLQRLKNHFEGPLNHRCIECDYGEMMSPISYTVYRDFDVVDRVDALVAVGAQPNDSVVEGRTALIMSISCTDFAAVECLLAHGAYVNAAPRGDTPLYLSILRGHLPMIECLLLYGADINQACGDRTPLSGAIEMRDLPVVRYLLERGASLSFPSSFLPTALFAAVSTGEPSILKCLLDSETCDVDVLKATDHYGFTALFYALHKGRGELDCADLLVQYGARHFLFALPPGLSFDVVVADEKVHPAHLDSLLEECPHLIMLKDGLSESFDKAIIRLEDSGAIRRRHPDERLLDVCAWGTRAPVPDSIPT